MMKNSFQTVCALGLILLCSCGKHRDDVPVRATQGIGALPVDALTVLYYPSQTNYPVAVLDLSDVHLATVRGANCEILNLTAKLCLVKSVTIRETQGGERIQVDLHDILQDTIPCYPNVGGHQKDGISFGGGAVFELPPESCIRIYGEVLTLREAARKYPEIPAR